MNKRKRKQFINALILLTISIIVFAVFYYTVGRGEVTGESERFDAGWEVTLKGEDCGTVSLSEFTFPATNKNDVMVLRNTIPEDVSDITTLQILTYLSIVNISVDGNEIYEYGQNYYDAGKMVGSGYQFVQLPRDCAGKEIQVVFTATEDKAFTNVPVFELVDSDKAYPQFANNNKLAIYISLFLLMLGSILSIISAAAYFFNPAYLRLVWIGLFSSAMGIWSMCNTKILQIFCTDISINTTMEYISLYLAPIPFVLVILHTRDNITVWKKTALKVLAAVLVVFAAVSTLLHISGVCHYPQTVILFHIIAATGLISTVALTFHDTGKMTISDKIMYAGIFIMCGFLAVDLLRFNIQKYLFPEQESMAVSILPVGTLCFIILMIASYVAYFYDMILSRAEKETLMKQAYRDSLTGLYNRAKCDELFQELDNREEDYAIINFDMNGLKKVNDTYGHAEGDRLICDFAMLLTKAFGKYGTVMRMGGDEFVVLIRQKNIGRLDEIMGYYKELIKKDEVSEGTRLSASYGIVKRNDSEEHSAEKVYQEADKKMYSMKQESKKRKN